MKMAKIKSLEIQGFRAFGASPQTIALQSTLAVVCGSNSNGKSSLAEALEFLLTGRTTRREFTGSAAKEFAGSLRNAHLPAEVPVFVAAEIETETGITHKIERRLKIDYGARGDNCSSELTIDGGRAKDLSGIGLVLSQPPLEAPILLQHTLRYVVSAKPQERAAYFSALLELSDIESLRNSIAAARDALTSPENPLSLTLFRCQRLESMSGTLGKLQLPEITLAELEKTLLATVRASLPKPTESVDIEGAAAVLEAQLADKREMAFPINGFSMGGDNSWVAPSPELVTSLNEFLASKTLIDRELQRLLPLFEAVLRTPELAELDSLIDCPLCETPAVLGPERIKAIRDNLEASNSYRTALAVFQSNLREAKDAVSKIKTSLQRSCPEFMKWSREVRSQREFTSARLCSLVGYENDRLIGEWEKEGQEYEDAIIAATGLADALRGELDLLTPESLTSETPSQITLSLNALTFAMTRIEHLRPTFLSNNEELRQLVSREVDKVSETVGWDDLILLIKNRGRLHNELRHEAARERVRVRFEQALREIDNAREKLLDSRFEALSDGIAEWWTRLRPEEVYAFDGVQRGASGRRFIDLKAKLVRDKENPELGVVRDAVAVFSDSELNCLGLAAFLARATREQAGFIVLDDPVPASDVEHRAFFANNVLRELMNIGCQVILLTYDQRLAEDIQERYQHIECPPDSFLIYLNDPLTGAVLESKVGTFDNLLATAANYIRNHNPEIRKIGSGRLRDAAERFCKLMLVKHRASSGDGGASINDYAGKSLGILTPDVIPLLTQDPAHPGKLRQIANYLNPGSHDDEVPPAASLTIVKGDLFDLGRRYLSGRR